MATSWTQNGYVLSEVISALQKSVRRGEEEAAMYWALELCPLYERYLWRRIMVILHEDIGIAEPALLFTIPACRALYFEMRKRPNGEYFLPLGNAILLMCRAQKTRIGCHFAVEMHQQSLDVRKDKSLRRAIPDYAIDMHTAKGKAMGRGEEHFRVDGSKLVPPTEFDDFYEPMVYERMARKRWNNTDETRWALFKGKADDVDLTEISPLFGISDDEVGLMGSD